MRMTNTKVKKTVDQYLNEVDYTELNQYKPTEFSINFVNFIKLVNGGNESNVNPPAHYKMIDGLTSRNNFLANLCCRGASKTSIFAEYLIPFLAIFRHIPNFGEVDTCIFLGDSMENGVKNVRKNIEARYERSDFLKKYLPQAKFTDGYIEFTNATGERFGVRLFGAKSGFRGAKIFGKRPVLAILDDLVSDEDSRSPTVLQNIKDTIYKGVLPALDPNKRKIVFNGTPFTKDDPLYEAVESGEWVVNVYPVCEEFPCTKKDFRGLWEDRFNYEAIQEAYDLALGTGQIKAFRQEYMLRIASVEDRMILDDDIRWFKTTDILDNKQRYNFYITSDFATSTSRKADYTVIGVWAVDMHNNRYLMGGVYGRQLMNQTFDDLFALVQKYTPMGTGVEISGQQGAFISLIKKEMVNRNIYFTIARAIGSTKEGIPAVTNKMSRFNLVVPLFKAGHIYLPEDLKHTKLIQAILDQLSMVTFDGIKAKNDDCIDMISQMGQMYITVPDAIQGNLGKQEKSDPYADDILEFDSHSYEDYL